MSIKTFPLVLTESYMLTSKVKHFVFQSQHNSSFDYIPGQFITIFFKHEDKIQKRSYSIANPPCDENRIEFSAGFRENGIGSLFLFNLKPGDTIEAAGPFGRLVLKDSTPKRYIFIATSTGVTPYRAMLNELKRRLESKQDLHIIILQGVRTQKDLLFKDEFLDFSSRHSNVEFRAYYSQESTAQLENFEHTGYVQQALPSLMLKPHEDMVYLCGNPSMIDEAYSMLKTIEFPTENIIREKYT